MIVTEENRPQKPDSWYGGVLGMAIKHCHPLDGMDVIDPDFWNTLFEYWTYPFPVKPPRAYDLYGVQHLRSFIQQDMMDDWPDEWWSTLEDAFMFPEYIKRY